MQKNMFELRLCHSVLDVMKSQDFASSMQFNITHLHPQFK